MEACLALFEASGDGFYADFTDTLLTLFLTRFHHAPSRCIGEFFDELLDPAPGEAGDHIEPAIIDVVGREGSMRRASSRLMAADRGPEGLCGHGGS